ncbi:MAG: galactokinase [Candidatus Latescibacterota bacterium]|nr:MAG: galactokinase [Candidatus Latescibacterota bacterium]
MDMKTELLSGFLQLFGSKPELAVKAPGRVNLIGEHTDYNDGFVLPVAVNRSIGIAARGREDQQVSLYSLNFKEMASFPLDGFGRDGSWADYPKGVIHEYQKLGEYVSGFDAVVYGDIPLGAGLSSSAAFEVATAYLLAKLNRIEIKPEEMARLCQRAENLYVGVNCGIMDQFVAVLGKKGHALFLDCRDLSYQYAYIPSDEVSVVVCDSGVRRGLSNSEYNLRRSQCEQGAKRLATVLPGAKALRDISIEQFEEHQGLLPDGMRRMCRHVISENSRVKEAVVALRRGDVVRFGQLMNLSHQSLKDEFQVSCRELDLLVEIARSVDGVLGARLTGAGFGGCTVNLVRKRSAPLLAQTVEEKYEAETGIKPAVYPCQIEDGVREIPITT